MAFLFVEMPTFSEKIWHFSHMKFKTACATIYVVISGLFWGRKGLYQVFQVGQQVLYGIHGICRIADVEVRVIDRKKVEYYVLEPVEQAGSRYYIPTQNQVAVSKLRPMMDMDQLLALLNSEEARKDCWIGDENARKQYYRSLINSGDRAALLSMVRTLLQHKASQSAAGKKFHICDENFLRDAQKLLSSEFSLILGIPASQVGDYIAKAMETA